MPAACSLLAYRGDGTEIGRVERKFDPEQLLSSRRQPLSALRGSPTDLERRIHPARIEPLTLVPSP